MAKVPGSVFEREAAASDQVLDRLRHKDIGVTRERAIDASQRHKLPVMTSCPTCGHEIRKGARFCESCGASLATELGAGSRRTVTILFTDVVGSTELGERLDPERLQALLGRYFDAARG